jgi:hypothetical protein
MRDDGGTYGFLCTFKIGTAVIDVFAGVHKSQMEIHVGPGFGPCADKPQIAKKVILLSVLPKHIVKQEPEPPLLVIHPEQPAEVAILPPPPVPIVAPAPPVAGGYARKEKHESAREQQGSDFSALPVSSRFDPVPVQEGPGGLLVVASIFSLALVTALGAAIVFKSRGANSFVRSDR